MIGNQSNQKKENFKKSVQALYKSELKFFTEYTALETGFLPHPNPNGILQMELLIWGQLSPMDFTNVWQLSKFLGWEAALLWKCIVLSSPQNFSFVTQGEMQR